MGNAILFVEDQHALRQCVQGRPDALRNAGAIPWIIPLLSDDPDTLREIFDRLDGLFLAGGADVSPARYGEAAKPYLGATDPERDAVETALVRMALDARRPIFAVCRGLQLLNVACGGGSATTCSNRSGQT